MKKGMAIFLLFTVTLLISVPLYLQMMIMMKGIIEGKKKKGKKMKQQRKLVKHWDGERWDWPLEQG